MERKREESNEQVVRWWCEGSPPSRAPFKASWGLGRGSTGGAHVDLVGDITAGWSGCLVVSGRGGARMRRPGALRVSEVREGGARARQGVHGVAGEGPGGAASASRGTRQRAVREEREKRRSSQKPPGKFFPITDRSLSSLFLFLSLFQKFQ